jgi:hypothetical protein
MFVAMMETVLADVLAERLCFKSVAVLKNQEMIDKSEIVLPALPERRRGFPSFHE